MKGFIETLLIASISTIEVYREGEESMTIIPSRYDESENGLLVITGTDITELLKQNITNQGMFLERVRNIMTSTNQTTFKFKGFKYIVYSPQ